MNKEYRFKSRRDFMKELTFFSSSATLLASAPWVQAFAQDNGKHSGANDTVRIGVIGTGSRGKYIMRKLQRVEGCKIIAICDIYKPNYDKGLELAGAGAKGFDDHRKMLEEMQDMDAVVVTSPLYCHAEHTIDSLQAGCHVFCEKSMARTVADCQRMVDVQQETKKVLMIGHQRLFSPVYLHALERIKNGEIGDIKQVRAYWHRNNDWRRKCPDTSLERQINWRLYLDSSAGLMTELASHQIQVANWFTGNIPTQVMGAGSICRWKDGREVYDQVALVYDYANGSKLLYDSVIANKFYGLEEQIMGTQGTIEPEVNKFYLENPPKMEKDPAIQRLVQNIGKDLTEAIPIGGASWVPEIKSKYTGEKVVEYKGDDGSQAQMDGFVKAVRNGKPYKRQLQEAYHASVGALLGEQAMLNNEIVQWTDENKILRDID